MIRYNARWVLPVGSPALRDATVCVENSTIAWVGARNEGPPGDNVELGDAIIIPGLVNAHLHLDLTAFADALPRASFFVWVRSLVRGLADASDERALADVSRFTVADQLARGVTTIAHTGPSAAAFDAMRELGARGIAFFETFGPDASQCTHARDALVTLLRDVRGRATELVRVGVSPHAPYSVSDDLYGAVAALAINEHLPVAVHIAESADETRLVREAAGDFASFLAGRGIDVARRGGSPIALLERTGILETRPLCIHAIQVDAADIERLANAGATVAHCPRANAWLGHGSAPVAALRAARVAVGLGTDSAASNDGLSILAEARAVPGQLDANERLEMATRGGAAALGLDGMTGSIRVGHQADLAVFRIGDTAACDANPAHYLMEHCTDAPSLLTMVAGAIRSRDGVVDGFDDAIVTRMAGHRARVQAWSAGLANANRTILDSTA